MDVEVDVDIDIDRYFGCLNGVQSGFRYASWYRNSYGTDVHISETASPVSVPENTCSFGTP